MKRIKERKGACRALGIKQLTHNDPYAGITRVTNKHRFAAEITLLRCLVDVACRSLSPTGMHELIKKLTAMPARCPNAEHPEIRGRQGGVPRIQGEKVRG